MSLVMKKYTYQDKNYLVYDRNILDKGFSAEQWAFICSESQGIGVDFVLDITNDNVYVYNMYGETIHICEDIVSIILNKHHCNVKNADIIHDIEVRFTDYYINKLTFIAYDKLNSYSA